MLFLFLYLQISKPIYLKQGPRGFYINFNNKNFKLKDGLDENLTEKDAIECVSEVQGKGSRIIKKLGNSDNEYIIGVGQYGPYVKFGKHLPIFLMEYLRIILL